MNPFKTLFYIFLIFLFLGLLSFFFPKEGIDLKVTVLHFPSFFEIFFTEATENSLNPKESPEEILNRMLLETKKREFTAFADSLAFYEKFFKEGGARFDLPDEDPTWFDKFFLNLEIASLGDTGIHILHYGDSQLEEDRISSTIREDLQTMFGGRGPGMIPAVASVPAMTYTHTSSGALSRKIVFGDTSLLALHNRYGVLGQVGELKGSAKISFRKRKQRKNDFSRIEGFDVVRLIVGQESSDFKATLSYDAQVQVNDSTFKEERKIADALTVEKKEKITIYKWTLEHPGIGATLSLQGKAEIYGIVADSSAGVSVDNIAMRGSSGTIFHKIDKSLLKESFEALNVKLLILQYGGNMVPGMNASTEDWARKVVSRQIKILQTIYPEADIVFIGPADMCKQINGKMQSYPGLNRTIKVLKEIAKEYGIAYWDMHRVMGGDNSMISFVKQNPPLGASDYIHFTRAGAIHMGDLFSYSLKVYYDYFKFREAHKIDAKKLKEIKTFADSVQKNQDAFPLDSLSVKDTSGVSGESL